MSTSVTHAAGVGHQPAHPATAAAVQTSSTNAHAQPLHFAPIGAAPAATKPDASADDSDDEGVPAFHDEDDLHPMDSSATAAPAAPTQPLQPLQSTMQVTAKPLAFAPIGSGVTVNHTPTASLSSLSLNPAAAAAQPLNLTPAQPLQFNLAAPNVTAAQPLSFAPLPVPAAHATAAAPQSVAQVAAPTAVQPAAAGQPAASGAAPVAAPATGGGGVGSDGIPIPCANPIPKCPEIVENLPIVDEKAAFEQCQQEWPFFVELVHDLFKDRQRNLQQLEALIASNEHFAFQKEAHTVKGAALNLHLPGLVDITKKVEMVGKQLVLTPNEQTYLDARRPLVAHLVKEYARLEAVLPMYEQKALDQPEGDGGEYFDDEGEGAYDDGAVYQ